MVTKSRVFIDMPFLENYYSIYLIKNALFVIQ